MFVLGSFALSMLKVHIIYVEHSRVKGRVHSGDLPDRQGIAHLEVVVE